MNTGKPRVLLADPHTLVLEGLQALLADRYAVVGSASEGETLVRCALSLRPDLVVCEVRMPGLSGLEAVRRILAGSPGTRVVFLTSEADTALASQAFALGVTGYLLKSSHAAEFLLGLRAALDGRRVLSRLLAGGDPAALPGPRRADRAGRLLSPRAEQVVCLLTEGLSMKQVAAALGIATRTVAYHKYGVMRALELRSSAELVRFAVDNRIVEPRRPLVGAA